MSEKSETKVKKCKIMTHPDKDEIIAKLNNGESVRVLASWLKKKYPRAKNMWLSVPTIQAFRANHLNLQGQFLKDVQRVAEEQKKQVEALALQRQVEATSAYQDKLNQIAETHLDYEKKIINTAAIVESRIKYWYDAIANKEELPSRADKELRKYLELFMKTFEQYKKLVEGMADTRVEHNVNISIVHDQSVIIRDVIRDVLQDFGPEKAILFVEKLNKRLNQGSLDINSSLLENKKTYVLPAQTEED